ncbi:MAG: trypsin-like peptidase domain-containing protein [bacterium]
MPNPEKTTIHPGSISTGFISVVIIISLLIGAISGAVFGVFAANGDLDSYLPGSLVKSSNSSKAVSEQTVQLAEESATVDVVDLVGPSVVSIIGTQDLSKISQQNDFFGDFFGFSVPQGGERQVSGGSGFIVSSDGLILTNKHVVDQDNIDYSVVLNDGTSVEAQVLAKDPSLDLALIKVDKTGLPVVKLGDSDNIQVGQTVIAIGNALGRYQNTVTKGVVSGLSRTIEAGDGMGQSELIENTIQTDAAINSGNSGGPLLNISGEVIGVNTAVSTQGQLIGFALPINAAKNDIESVQETGKIIRPFMGIRYTIITDEVQEANDLSVDHGAILVRGDSVSELAVIPGSPADKAGLEENDILLEIDGVQISEDNSITSILSEYRPNDVVSLKVLHDGEEKTVELTLGEREG